MVYNGKIMGSHLERAIEVVCARAEEPNSPAGPRVRPASIPQLSDLLGFAKHVSCAGHLFSEITTGIICISFTSSTTEVLVKHFLNRIR